MKSKFVVLLIGLLAATQHFAPAQTPALSFTNGSLFGAPEGTYGWAFTLSNTISVTDLGYFDFGDNGLNAPHDVGIWASNGTLLVSATVPSGTADALNGDFRYVIVTPTLLGPGSYVIGGFESGDTSDPIAVNAATVTTASIISYDGSRSVSSTALAFASGDSAAHSSSYFGPNFEFNNVPEPTTSALLLFGGLSVAGFARKRWFSVPKH